MNIDARRTGPDLFYSSYIPVQPDTVELHSNKYKINTEVIGPVPHKGFNFLFETIALDLYYDLKKRLFHK